MSAPFEPFDAPCRTSEIVPLNPPLSEHDDDGPASLVTVLRPEPERATDPEPEAISTSANNHQAAISPGGVCTLQRSNKPNKTRQSRPPLSTMIYDAKRSDSSLPQARCSVPVFSRSRSQIPSFGGRHAVSHRVDRAGADVFKTGACICSTNDVQTLKTPHQRRRVLAGQPLIINPSGIRLSCRDRIRLLACLLFLLCAASHRGKHQNSLGFVSDAAIRRAG